MISRPITELVSVNLQLAAEEARGLYAELYRISADKIMAPYPADSQIAELMQELAKCGADQ